MLNYLMFLSMVYEYAYFYEYIWKPVYCPSKAIKKLLNEIQPLRQNP